MECVRPDRAEYARLRAALDDESTRTSFDGADQGFLDAIYGGAMRAAPRFAALETAGAPARAGLGASVHTTHRALRLEVGWNLPHTYWLLGGLDWSAARRGRWRETPASRIPAASLAFPIAPALKPWHWWSVALLDSQWGWHFYRAQLRGAASAAGASAAQWGAVLTAAYCASRWAQRRAARRAQHRSAQRRVRHGTAAMLACAATWLPARAAATLVGAPLAALCALGAALTVRRGASPLLGWAHFLTVLVCAVEGVAYTAAALRGAPPPPRPRFALAASAVFWLLLAAAAPSPWSVAPPPPASQARALATKAVQIAALACALRGYVSMLACGVGVRAPAALLAGPTRRIGANEHLSVS